MIRLVSGLFKEHGVPAHIRSDNGPEFIAKHYLKRLLTSHINAIAIYSFEFRFFFEDWS